MTLEPTISLVRRQGEVERYSITRRIPMVACHAVVVVRGAGVHTVRKCVHVDAHQVECGVTKVDRFQQVNATFQSVCGAPGGRT